MTTQEIQALLSCILHVQALQRKLNEASKSQAAAYHQLTIEQRRTTRS